MPNLLGHPDMCWVGDLSNELQSHKNVFQKFPKSNKWNKGGASNVCQIYYKVSWDFLAESRAQDVNTKPDKQDSVISFKTTVILYTSCAKNVISQVCVSGNPHSQSVRA